MRPTLLLCIVFVAPGACTPALRAVQLDFNAGAPQVEVFDAHMTSRRPRPTLVIAREVVDGWNFLYLNITRIEFAVCLEGMKERDRTVITGFRLAHIISSTTDHIEFVPCAGSRHVGTAHSHPEDPNQDPCHHSAADQRSFRKDGNASVDIVICGRDRFVWVLKDGRGPRQWHAGLNQ